jgi:hypothetical protein
MNFHYHIQKKNETKKKKEKSRNNAFNAIMQ